MDLPAPGQELDDRPAHEEAIEAAGRHRLEGEPLQSAVIDVRGRARWPRLRPRGPDREDRGRPLPPRRDHAGQKLRRLLEVRRQNGRGLAGRLLQACDDRHLRSEVAGQANSTRGRPIRRDRPDPIPGGVFGTVVHEDRLEVEVALLRDLAKPRGQRSQRLRVEIDRDDHGNPLAAHVFSSKTRAGAASAISLKRPGPPRSTRPAVSRIAARTRMPPSGR